MRKNSYSYCKKLAPGFKSYIFLRVFLKIVILTWTQCGMGDNFLGNFLPSFKLLLHAEMEEDILCTLQICWVLTLGTFPPFKMLKILSFWIPWKSSKIPTTSGVMNFWQKSCKNQKYQVFFSKIELLTPLRLHDNIIGQNWSRILKVLIKTFHLSILTTPSSTKLGVGVTFYGKFG